MQQRKCLFFFLIWYLLNWKRIFNLFGCFYYFKDNFTHRNHSSSEEMNCLPRSLTNLKSTQVEFGNCNDGVTPNDEISGDGCRRLVGITHNQQAQNPINGKKRKEVDTSNFQPSINLSKKQANKTLHNQVNNCWKIVWTLYFCVFLLVCACDFLCFSYFKCPHQIILFEWNSSVVVLR